MIYQIEFKPRALKDLKAIDIGEARRIIEKVEALQNDLAGNVKRLTNFTPEYRLRAGKYRVLFEVEGAKVVIYRVRHRKDAYS
ncbi:MAG TPA: type II toxin-antitoxin system RelE/ParE family toxin [Pyrinomonadaceae bacterium]|nr:type II toxin-antitoxin system RelE/ParE family toxin [Pyrinomonadaceae bacterium]